MRKIEIVMVMLSTMVLTACAEIPKTVEMNYGETYKIQENLGESDNIDWECEDSNIVNVSDDGTVTAEAPGKAKIFIKENNKIVETYIFNVKTIPIEQIVFSTDSVEVTDGDTITLKYTLLPQGASDYGITWTSVDESIATVYNDGNIELKGQAEGKTTIIATTEDGVSAQCSIKVVPKSAYDQLGKDEKQFVDDILSVINDFKNPSTVKFNKVNKTYAGAYVFVVAAQNSFGGNTVERYYYSKETNMLMEWFIDEDNEPMNADLITQAVHEKLGY